MHLRGRYVSVGQRPGCVRKTVIFCDDLAIALLNIHFIAYTGRGSCDQASANVSTFSVWKYQREMVGMVHGYNSVDQPDRHVEAMRGRQERFSPSVHNIPFQTNR